MDIQGANLFFQFIARCYEKTSTVFTSNKILPFLSKAAPDFYYPPRPPKTHKISSAFSYNFKSALTYRTSHSSRRRSATMASYPIRIESPKSRTFFICYLFLSLSPQCYVVRQPRYGRAEARRHTKSAVFCFLAQNVQTAPSRTPSARHCFGRRFALDGKPISPFRLFNAAWFSPESL